MKILLCHISAGSGRLRKASSIGAGFSLWVEDYLVHGFANRKRDKLAINIILAKSRLGTEFIEVDKEMGCETETDSFPGSFS